MCERCVTANRNLTEHRERIEKMVTDAVETLKGNYNEDVQRMVNAEPFPEEKPFMEFLFRFGSAIETIALCYAMITGEMPSIVLGELAGLALETEMENGMGRELASLLNAVISADEGPRMH